MAKVIKKKKLRLLPFLIFIIVIAVIVFVCLFVLDTKVKNIIITGNEVLSDDDIIELAGLTDYPSFYKTLNLTMKNNLKENPLIESVDINRSFYHIIEIDVKEYEILYKRKDKGKYVLENKKEVTLDKETPYTIPRLINTIPKKILDRFIKYYKRVDLSIREKISEIKYDPNEFDEERFLLYMDDGNSVYITITKFERLNYYNEVLPQLDGKKGYLYLDSGNHFQIMQ